MADCKIRNVYTGIAGSHIRSFNSRGMVAIKDKEVTAADVARVIETARAVEYSDRSAVFAYGFAGICRRQSREDVREPIGMSGMRLEVKVHIVTGAVSAVAEYCQMHTPVRTRGFRSDSAAAGFCRCRTDRG